MYMNISESWNTNTYNSSIKHNIIGIDHMNRVNKPVNRIYCVLCLYKNKPCAVNISQPFLASTIESRVDKAVVSRKL